ncbi:MAG: sigma-70 family RNA polymerase sigma factor [Candidatus Goldbacteria bacterium]|nr:sigma-70 family RNA polymerase sigma factor [Candidatus Goldiibacteriota bacterium]
MEAHDLMQRIKQGDKNAFNELLDKYQQAVLNYAYRFIRSRQEAEDIAQEVFIKVYKGAGNYSPSAKFTTWLYRIVSNTAIDFLRKKKTDAGLGAKSIHEETGEQGAENFTQIADNTSVSADLRAEKNQAEENINKALLSLPENQRMAIVLLVYEEKSYKEIARIMSVSAASVESLIFRARENLKKSLKV